MIETLLLLFVSGALLANAIPHLSAGLRGDVFPTPFARPRGTNSSAVVNVLWGSLNLFVGMPLFVRPLFDYPSPWVLLAFVAGWLTLGLYLAWRFAGLRRGH